jgi:hypothetical protein
MVNTIKVTITIKIKTWNLWKIILKRDWTRCGRNC